MMEMRVIIWMLGCSTMLHMVINQVQGKTAVCNNHVTDNGTCCLNSTQTDCPAGLLMHNKTSSTPCSEDQTMDTTSSSGDTTFSGYSSSYGDTTFSRDTKPTTNNPMNYTIVVCVVKCPDGPMNNTDNRCIRCNENCLTCEGQVTSCTSCNSSLDLEGSKCVKKPPKTSTKFIAIIAGGAVFLVAVAMIIMCCIRRRRTAKQNEQDNFVPVSIAEQIQVNQELDEEETVIEATSCDIYENIPRPDKQFSMKIQDGHDKVLRYTGDPTYKGDAKKTDETRIDEEEQELKNLPRAPSPPRSNVSPQGAKTSNPSKRVLPHHSVIAEDDAPDYCNIQGIIIEQDDYVNKDAIAEITRRATVVNKKKEENVAVKLPSDDEDGKDDYENESVISVIRKNTDKKKRQATIVNKKKAENVAVELPSDDEDGKDDYENESVISVIRNNTDKKKRQATIVSKKKAENVAVELPSDDEDGKDDYQNVNESLYVNIASINSKLSK